MSNLTDALTVLSAMITPAVLILACGSLILTTSNRLTRVIDRVRELAVEIEGLAQITGDEEFITEKRAMLFDLLDMAIQRARLLQRAITRLYLALSTFVATSVTIGIVAVAEMRSAVAALILGFIGAGLMLWSSFLLIVESRIGLASSYTETDFLWRRGQHHAPPDRPQKKNALWRML